ncbi:MAG: anaerobic selenocysteine-containing dehydrogenase [Cryomorphaceae bacterium]|jgi:anaerobic selenocysteine-containing dehydrogenase
MTFGTSHTADTVCPLDCADTCSLKVDVEGDQITRVRGSKLNAFTQGKICTKVATGMVEWVHGVDRIQTPLRRVGAKGDAKFEAISWDDAYRIIKEKFKQIINSHGAEAILPLKYAGPMGVLSVGSMDSRLFNRMGASQLNSVPLCTAASAAGWNSVLGGAGGIAHSEMEHSKLMVVWANNITVGHLHLVKRLRNARKSGAKLVVIDPKRIRIADDADLFLQINPGTDVVLAYAVANQIREMGGLDQDFINENVAGADQYLAEAKTWPLSKASDVCGVPQQDIKLFASYWCDFKPASLTMGVALERTRNGGSATRAVMALPLLTGNFGPKGAGICDPSSYFNIDQDYLRQNDWIDKSVRTINILDVGEHIVSDNIAPPIKALFIYNHNPVAVHPRQKLMLEALQKEDLFTVGYDLVMTDTMRYMDIILPACSPMEYSDLYKAYGHTVMQRSKAVIPPVGQSRPNTQVFRELAAVFGFDEPEFRETDQDMLNAALPELIDEGGLIDKRDAQDAKVVFRDVKPMTASHKALLFNQAEQDRAQLGVPKYQPLEAKRSFTLVSPSSDKRINSTLGGSTANKEQYQVEICARDAAFYQLSVGQKVRLVNEQAEVVVHLTISDRIKPGTAYVPKGAWCADSESRLSINALIPGGKSDMGDGACYNDTQVDILPA